MFRALPTELRFVAFCGLLAIASTAHGQTFGDLADSTAEGVVLKVTSERLDAAHKLAVTGRPAVKERAAGAQPTKLVSKPGVFVAPTTPPPPPPPPSDSPIAPVQTPSAPSMPNPYLPLPAGIVGQPR